ncbi:MAG: 2-dehydropantoate 2-reductase [Verrucomicrobiales bacterium]|jgi:2-dehydropantoate 2-reductase
MRSDLEHVKKRGLKIKSKQGDFHLQGAKVYADTSQIGACDLVLIALKSTSNHALEELLPPLIKEDTMLLTLQNGLGNEEFLAAKFGAHRVIGGLCFVCINRVAPGEIHHLGAGTISIGEFNGLPHPRTHEIASEFKRSGVVCNVKADLARECWKKLVWNIPFNGLSIAAGGIDVAQILADDELKQRARELMREVINSAKKLGHDLPISLVEDQIKATLPMGAYKPSSLIDYLEGRAVEVEAIWGEPLRRAKQAGAKTPELEKLYSEISTCMDSRRSV